MEKKPSYKSREVALMAVFAATYAVGVTLLAPISFPVFQVRVADILLPLSVLFGLPAIIGLTLGNVVGNLSSPFGIIDVVGGTAANFLATFLAWQIGRRQFTGAWLASAMVEVVTITAVVGTYLAFLIEVPLWLSWVGVLIGETISVGFGGYLLLKGVDRVLGRRLYLSVPRNPET
jgi:uncharacterized membrane protein